MQLQEVLSNPVPITWKEKSNEQWRATFIIDKIPYEAKMSNFTDIDEEDQDEWEVEFYIDFQWARKNQMKTAQGISKTGNQFQILATVVKAFDEFLKKQKPFAFAFSAKEKSRQRLYDRFAKIIPKKYPYKTTEAKNGLYSFERNK